MACEAACFHSDMLKDGEDVKRRLLSGGKTAESNPRQKPARRTARRGLRRSDGTLQLRFGSGSEEAMLS
ncbi:hypothetical protein OJAV_G00027280 [Oryzias javanicus]|uniref:Uncharacterized protein n=1 Tax=Oryzias javanicus TaxID=123683 RepID=A0A3S2UNN7_ORYJA|nr:hypothetical protein OJAV_G00027280 [Oryzias javanicus]